MITSSIGAGSLVRARRATTGCVLACLLGSLLSGLSGCIGAAELERVERAVDQLARQSREQETRFRSLAQDSQGSADQAVTIEAEHASTRAGQRAQALEDARSQLAALRAQDVQSASELGRLLDALGPIAANGGLAGGVDGGLGGGVWGLGGMLIGAGAWGIARGWAMRRGLDRVGRALEAAASEEPAVAEALRKRREDLGLIRSAGVRRMLEAPAVSEDRPRTGASAGYRDSGSHPAD